MPAELVLSVVALGQARALAGLVSLVVATAEEAWALAQLA